MENNKLLAVDLFSGAGGMSLGFLQTGEIEILVAVENNVNAKKTYNKNHPDVEVLGDIRKIDYEDIKRKCKQHGRDRINLVFGGPPCQGFSNANRQKTELISSNNQLVKDYVKAIEKLQPDAFVMENVKAMKSGKHKFFYSSKDENEIHELNLIPKYEKIIMGKKNKYTNELLDFLRESKDLSWFIINDKVLFSKLSHLSRKRNEVNKYLQKYQGQFTKYFDAWADLHKAYWNEGYKTQWTHLKDLIQVKNPSVNTIDELYLCLSEIIETQKIIMRMREVLSNKIEIYGISSDHRFVNIDVKTYCILDYLIAKFKKLGYKLNDDPLVLNAANFGVPQLRERLFLIGIKKDVVHDLPVDLPIQIFC